MYDSIRIIIIGVLAMITMVFLKKKNKLNQITITLTIVIAMILYLVFYMIPIENLFYTFPEAEQAFNYYYSDKEYISHINGEQSSMVLYANDSANVTMFLTKTQEGYKLPKVANFILVKNIEINGIGLATIYKVKDTNDYYIYGSIAANNDIDKITYINGEKLKMTKNNAAGKIWISFYDYLKTYEDGCYIIVDDKVIKL